MSRSTSRGQRIILANASAPASPTILFLRQLLAPATHFLPEQQGRTSPMKCLAVTALLLVVAAPGLAQAPSDNPWTSSETKTDADAQAKAMHERLDLDRDGYVTVDEVDRFAKLETGATGNSNARVAAFVRRLLLQRDSDHDGRLSLAESLAGTDAAFASMDTNHDGVVTPDERRAALAAIVQQTTKIWRSTASH
jgi:Ca2+-binding EF-hand superfamily protein